MKTSVRVVVLIAGALVVVAAIAAAVVYQPRAKSGSGDEATRTATVAVVTERDFAPRVLATGSVRLMAGARIEVGARVSGIVQTLAVTQGSHVNRGDVIARLDTLEAQARLRQADARLAELDASVRQLTEDLGRAESLAKDRVMTSQDLLAARTALAAAKSRVDAARADRELARVQLDYTVIRSPISGVVASVTTHEGETVAASLAAPTFVTLIDPTRLECVALVDETDIGHVTVGDSAEFTVDAYPGRVFRGTVSRIAPDASVIGGVVDYEVTIRLTGDYSVLKPQMTASVNLQGASRRAMVIPIAAVRQSPQGTYAWKRRGNSPPERVAIRLGARQSDVAEVRSGLKRGDTVLTSGFPDAR